MSAGTNGMRARLLRAWKRSGSPASSPEPVREEEPPEHLDECRLRTEVTLEGRITVLTLSATGVGRGLEAELDDGTGTVRLVWLGRPSVPGIVAGRRLRVTGRLTQSDGRRTIFNPRYQLLAS
ncbi:MAG TPA: OB-fold nucleic acid binding domain-containing protein [Propionibacteriaceae bacterium]|nr:OB-fold nucleic acid binding domain-containing protein [Propionibacteriaceae bacterium]